MSNRSGGKKSKKAAAFKLEGDGRRVEMDTSARGLPPTMLHKVIASQKRDAKGLKHRGELHGTYLPALSEYLKSRYPDWCQKNDAEEFVHQFIHDFLYVRAERGRKKNRGLTPLERYRKQEGTPFRFYLLSSLSWRLKRNQQKNELMSFDERTDAPQARDFEQEYRNTVVDSALRTLRHEFIGKNRERLFEAIVKRLEGSKLSGETLAQQAQVSHVNFRKQFSRARRRLQNLIREAFVQTPPLDGANAEQTDSFGG